MCGRRGIESRKKCLPPRRQLEQWFECWCLHTEPELGHGQYEQQCRFSVRAVYSGSLQESLARAEPLWRLTLPDEQPGGLCRRRVHCYLTEHACAKKPTDSIPSPVSRQTAGERENINPFPRAVVFRNPGARQEGLLWRQFRLSRGAKILGSGSGHMKQAFRVV